MGIIGGALKSAAKKVLLVALVYGGKKIAGKITGKMVKTASKKKSGEI